MSCMKKKKKDNGKGMSSDFATLDDDPTTKKIKKILREKHPGYEKIVLMEKRLIPHVRQFLFI